MFISHSITKINLNIDFGLQLCLNKCQTTKCNIQSLSIWCPKVEA